jgi:hypothetical protein
MRTFSMWSRLLKRVHTLIFGFLLFFSDLFSILIVLVSHTILLHQLKCVGASSQALWWFKSYLWGRRKYVRIGSAVPSVLPLSHGVPQGTILSPLLFCIYTNDIPAIPLSSDIDSYVDDSKLFLMFSMKDIKQQLSSWKTISSSQCSQMVFWTSIAD